MESRRGRVADAAAAGRRRPWTKRERKLRGGLYFLWVQFDPDDLDAAFAVIRVLGLKSMHSSASSLIELDQRPSEQQLRWLGQIDGVREVRLAP